jgi:hypothetical protein
MGMKTYDAVVMPPECAVQAQQGSAYFDPQRIKKFIATFKRMKQEGHEICVPWGHYLNATPNEEAFLRSRFNSGYVEDLFEDSEGRLIARCTVPPGLEVDSNGDLIDKVNHTRIREVSAGIGDFIDGNGTYWEDAILHVALTPQPVIHKHAKLLPPKQIATNSLITLSHGKVRWASLLGFQKMDEQNTLFDDNDADNLDGITGDPNAPEMPPEAPPEAMPPVNTETDQAVEMLAQLGIELPEGTTPENFISQLVGILAGLVAAGAKIQVEKKDLDENALKTESPGGMMFLSVQGMTPRERAWANREGKRIREQIRTDCDSLIAQGIPAHIVNKLKAQASRVHLSIHPETHELGLPEITEKLDWLKEFVKAAGEMATIKTTLDRAKAHDAPGLPPANEKSNEWLEKKLKDRYGPDVKVGSV